MNKMFCILLLLLCSGATIQAQTFSEWFSQKKTQKKYLIEQIAALKIYSGYLKKGYDIGKKGLGTISRIKNGEFNLHRDFFGSLSIVNPAIKSDPRIASVEKMQIAILDIKSQVLASLTSVTIVSQKEKQYIKDVFGRLVENCDHLLEELADVALSKNLTMKDDERLNRIDKIYLEMEDNFRFANYFSNQLAALVASRKQDLREADHSNLIFGIK